MEEMSLGWVIWVGCYVMVLLGLSAYGIHRYSIIYLFLKHRKDHPRPVKTFQVLPSVTVQLPLFNEFYVVDRLLEAVSNLDYPKDKLQIQILDDSTDETKEISRRWALELGARGFDTELIRRTDRTGYKAGALENGLKTATGEFLLILDADFVPAKNLLREMIHFFTDSQIGMIQTRWGHLNRNHSLLTRVQAMFLDGHLLLEQTARSRSGRFFNFNGTAGMWRRSCIVDSGGWHHDTLTEDLDLSYRAQLAGWRFVFLPHVVTPAELPIDMNGFKSQQHRWTKGSIQTCKKILPLIWKSRLPLTIKVEATAHLTSNFAYLLLAFLCVLLHPASGSPDLGWARVFVLDIPIFMASTLAVALFYLCAQIALNPRGWVKDILHLPLLLALGIGLSLNNGRAVIEALLNHPSDFQRTPKYGAQKGSKRWRSSLYAPIRSVLPLLELSFAIYFGWFVWSAWVNQQFISLPFLMLFAVGFAYVAFSSLLSWLPTKPSSQRRRDDDSPEPVVA